MNTCAQFWLLVLSSWNQDNATAQKMYGECKGLCCLMLLNTNKICVQKSYSVYSQAQPSFVQNKSGSEAEEAV